jgi:hypothetical protein
MVYKQESISMYTIKSNYVRYGEWQTQTVQTVNEVIAALAKLDNRFPWSFKMLTRNVIRAKCYYYTVNIHTSGYDINELYSNLTANRVV